MCPGALTEPEVQLQQRLQPEVGERPGRPRLGRAVPADEVCRGARREARRCQRGGRSDHPVEHDRHPARGGPEDEPGQRGVLQAAEFGEGAERVGGVEAGAAQGGADHLDLVGEHRRVAAGAGAGDLAGVGAGVGRNERRGRGGVADAEIAGCQQPITLVGESAGHLDPDDDGCRRLVPGERGGGRQVLGAVGDPVLPEPHSVGRRHR